MWNGRGATLGSSREWREGKEKLEPAVATEARMGSER